MMNKEGFVKIAVLISFMQTNCLKEKACRYFTACAQSFNLKNHYGRSKV